MSGRRYWQAVSQAGGLVGAPRAAPILLTLALLAASSRAEAGGQVIYIQPLGKQLPQPDVALVEKSLREFTGLEVKTLPRVKLPVRAYYKPRRRYRAEKLLDFLQARLPADGLRILGLTGSDISTTKGKVYDWGVVGLAMMDGSASVISSFRCKMGAKNRRHARERLAKAAVHEIGHTLGLEHCPVRGCLMEDARGKVRTFDREKDFCARCRRQLREAGRPLPDKPEIPWAQ
jgi:archaemetzincin